MDKKGIKFHVESNDYFGTLATRVDLLLQEISRRGYGRKQTKELKDMRDEVLYMQKRYLIKG